MKPFTYKIQRPINGFSVRSLILFKLNWIGLGFVVTVKFGMVVDEEIICWEFVLVT